MQADHIISEIRAEAARQRISQTALAEVLGVSQAAISARLTGRQQVDLAEFLELTDHLGVRASELLAAAEAAADAPVPSQAVAS